LKRISSHKGVIGCIVVNGEGIPIRTTLDNSSTVQYAGLLNQVTAKARSMVRDIDPQNDLTFLRIRSKKNEVMVAPDKEYLLIVIQSSTDWSCSASDSFCTAIECPLYACVNNGFLLAFRCLTHVFDHAILFVKRVTVPCKILGCGIWWWLIQPGCLGVILKGTFGD